jgi:hypothetical protein
MRLRCKLGIHKYEDLEMSLTKNIGYGWAGTPGVRLKQRCIHCLKERYMKLNMCMPDKDLYNENLWGKN